MNTKEATKTSLNAMKQEEVHRRDHKISTYKAENHSIIVEGTLFDQRLIDIHHFSGTIRLAGIQHDMVIRLLVNPDLTIEDVEVEMPGHPHEECPETMESLQQIKGLKISRGFTMKIKELFSQGRGCSHLSELLIAMAPAAVQGFWTAFSSDSQPENVDNTVKPFLTDTCWVWRKDGNAIKSL